MNATEHLQRYLEGWRLGDGALCLSATAPEFFYDDPNTGRIPREEFIGFVESFRAAVVNMIGGPVGVPFLNYTDTLISERDARCWCWWQAVGSELQGAALIRFGEAGVISERIAYFSKLPS